VYAGLTAVKIAVVVVSVWSASIRSGALTSGADDTQV